MTYPIFAAGQRLTAGQLAALQWTEVVQGVVLTVNNSATFVNTNIVVPTVANARYRYQLLAGYTSNPVIKLQWAVPTGGAVDRYGQGAGSGSSGGSGDQSTMSTRRMIAGDDVVLGGATNIYYQEDGVITGGSVDGNFTLQFAQNAATALDSSLSSATRLWYIRVD